MHSIVSKAHPRGSASSCLDDLAGSLSPASRRHPTEVARASSVVLDGTFAPTAEARALSKASVFCGANLRVLVRFSDFTGLPDAAKPDGASNRCMEMAFRLLLASGKNLDIVAHRFDGFPAATSDEFGKPPGVTSASIDRVTTPSAPDQMPAENRASTRFRIARRTLSASVATLEYHGVNAFRFIDVQAREVAVRYRLIPCAAEHVLGEVRRPPKRADDMSKEIAERLSRGPIRFDWYAQVAGRGDDICSPTAPWPLTRPLIRLGRIDIRDCVSDPMATDVKSLFLPWNLPEGIEAGDPRTAQRCAAHPFFDRG